MENEDEEREISILQQLLDQRTTLWKITSIYKKNTNKITETTTWTLLRDVMVTFECRLYSHGQKPTTLKTLGNAKRGTQKTCATCGKISKKNDFLENSKLPYVVENCDRKVYTIRCTLCGAKYTNSWEELSKNILKENVPHQGCTYTLPSQRSLESQKFPSLPVTEDFEIHRTDQYQGERLPGIESFDRVVLPSLTSTLLPSILPSGFNFNENIPQMGSKVTSFELPQPGKSPSNVLNSKYQSPLKKTKTTSNTQSPSNPQKNPPPQNQKFEIVQFSKSDIVTEYELPYEKVLQFDVPSSFSNILFLYF